MNTKNEIEKLFEKVDENKETLLILHVAEGDDFSSHGCGDVNAVAAAIATVVHGGFTKDADEDAAKLAKAIVDGVVHSMSKPSFAAVAILTRLTKRIIDILELTKKELGDKIELFDDDDDDDDDENCEECENNRWCPLPNAVKYRKENHIPAPKKRKNGKRGGKKNENAN